MCVRVLCECVRASSSRHDHVWTGRRSKSERPLHTRHNDEGCRGSFRSGSRGAGSVRIRAEQGQNVSEKKKNPSNKKKQTTHTRNVDLTNLILLALACFRPNIPTTFDAKISVEVYQPNQLPATANGAVAMDEASNRGIQFYKFDDAPQHKHVDVYELSRYDLGHTYFIDSLNKTNCTVNDVSGNMPEWFGWVSASQACGSRTFRHSFVVDFFCLAANEYSLGVGVPQSDPNRPYFFEINQTDASGDLIKTTLIVFDKWSTKTPNPNMFAVPHECM